MCNLLGDGVPAQLIAEIRSTGGKVVLAYSITYVECMPGWVEKSCHMWQVCYIFSKKGMAETFYIQDPMVWLRSIHNLGSQLLILWIFRRLAGETQSVTKNWRLQGGCGFHQSPS